MTNRTPPPYKWLANESAAIRGELLRRQALREVLWKKHEKAREAYDGARKCLDAFDAKTRDLDQRNAALRAALEAMGAPPALSNVPPVRGRGTWGRRGRFTEIILTALRTEKGPVGTPDIVAHVAAELRDRLPETMTRRQFRYVVHGRLCALAREGRVLRTAGAKHAYWRLP